MKTNYYANFRKASVTLLGAFCLGFLVFFSSCEKENDKGTTHFELKDNPTSLTASFQGTSQTFTVQSAGAWKVEPLRNEKWVKIEPQEGNGAGTFTVTVDRNSTLEARQSVLTFVVDGRLHNNVLRVEQEARTAGGGDNTPYLNLDGKSSLEISEEGIFGRYAVRSTGDWRIEIVEGADWLNVEPKEGRYDTGVNVSASVNASPTARTARLAFYLDDVLVPGTFEVNQEGMEVILFEDFNWLNYGSPIFYTTGGETRIDSWSAAEKEKGWGWYKPSADNIPSTYARVGFVKLGKTNYGSDILSPKLSAVQGTKNLVVSFKAVPYMTAAGNGDGGTLLQVGVVGPGTVSQSSFNINNWPDYAADPNCTEIWKLPQTTRTFTITGATAETQIWFLGGYYDLRDSPFGATRGNLSRIFLDDILVAVKK